MKNTSSPGKNPRGQRSKISIRPRLMILQKLVFVSSMLFLMATIIGVIFYFQFGNVEHAATAVTEIKTTKDKSDPGKSSIEITSVNPDPYTNRFKISFTKKVADAEVDFKLIDSAGRVVFKDIINSNDVKSQYDFVDQKGLPPGNYIVSLYYNDEIAIQKPIKKIQP